MVEFGQNQAKLTIQSESCSKRQKTLKQKVLGQSKTVQNRAAPIYAPKTLKTTKIMKNKASASMCKYVQVFAGIYKSSSTNILGNGAKT